MIRVMVDDLPKIEHKQNNTYSDVNNTYASIEDNYIIDLSGTIDWIGSGPLEFKWMDPTSPISIQNDFKTFSQDNAVHTFPWDWMNITAIHSGTHEFSAVMDHMMTVQARRLPGTHSEKTFQVKVKECLPHRNDSAPYPFHQGIVGLANNNSYPSLSFDDAFQADHTCCTPDFNYVSAAANMPCFNFTDYGPLYISNRDSLDDILHRTLQTGSGYVSGPPSYGAYSDEEYFDVFERQFIVTCDGMSGNTCVPGAGNVQHTITGIVEDCGAAPKHPRCEIAVYGTTPRCVDVGWKDAADPASKTVIAGGTCDNTFVCSRLGEGSPIVGGDCSFPGDPICMECQKTCDGLGNCNLGVNCRACSTCTDSPVHSCT